MGIEVSDLVGIIQKSGVDTDQLVAALRGATQGDGMTVSELIADQLPLLNTDTARTYKTTLRRTENGIVNLCDCLCPACAAADECGCGPSCKACAATVINLEPLGPLPVTKHTLRPAQLKKVVEAAGRSARKRQTRANLTRARRGLPPHAVHGNGATETAVRALSWMAERAIDEGLLDANPVSRIKAPARAKTHKRALRPDELAQFLDLVATGGNDPDLDILITWFHIETGARREGALSLICGVLRPTEQTARLGEKFDKYREQPLSADLLAALQHHAITRGGPRCDPRQGKLFDPSAPVFYYQPHKDGTPHPLTDKRYDTLFQRIQRTWPLAAEISLTAHGLRKLAGSAIERIAGTQVARVFLGHAQRTDTDLYTEASAEEVARAVAIWTGSPHPLARPTTPTNT